MAYEDTDRARLREPSRKELWPSRAEKNFRGESNAIIQRKAPDEMRTMAHVPQSECSDLDSVAARLRREEDADVREADYLRFCDDNERARLAREAKPEWCSNPRQHNASRSGCSDEDRFIQQALDRARIPLTRWNRQLDRKKKRARDLWGGATPARGI